MITRLLYTWFEVVRVHKVVKVVNVDIGPGVVDIAVEIRPRHQNRGKVTGVGLGRKCEAGKWVRGSAVIATERKGYRGMRRIISLCQCDKSLPVSQHSEF